MTRIALANTHASAGGGLRYLERFLDVLARREDGHAWLLFLPPGFPVPEELGRRARIEHAPAAAATALGRLRYEQGRMRRELRRWRAEVLINLGNFALFGAPCPQVVLHRNPTYYSPEFFADLRRRGERGRLLRTLFRRQLSILSLHAARLNVTPTAAFALELARETAAARLPLQVIPHGFDPAAIHREPEALPEPARCLLEASAGARRIVYLTHYTYFRNVETVLRALPLIRRAAGDVKLLLTARLGPGVRDYGHGYDTTAAWRLAESLGIAEHLLMLGPVPQGAVGSVYAAAELSVCASYAESFGHPLLEAMSCGVPVLSAGTPVHREICGAAAEYFPPFDHAALAAQAVRLLTDRAAAARLAALGRARAAQAIGWEEHAARLVRAAERVAAGGSARAARELVPGAGVEPARALLLTGF